MNQKNNPSINQQNNIENINNMNNLGGKPSYSNMNSGQIIGKENYP